jgi:hypothetical protein
VILLISWVLKFIFQKAKLIPSVFVSPPCDCLVREFSVDSSILIE